MVVVSSGAKAVLDIPKTIERLETLCVPVVGYRTQTFPAFYYRDSGYTVADSCETPKEISDLYGIHCQLGLSSSLLVVNPVSKENELPRDFILPIINTALEECSQRGISGKAVTPFLLKRIEQLSNGRSLDANLALAHSNIHLGCQIALAIAAK
jgi:pseudouridine-5'-phosphate glycosidase